MKWHIPIPYSHPLFEFLLFQSTGGGGGGGGGGMGPHVIWREINLCMKTAFYCTLNSIIKGVGYVKWDIYQSPTPAPPPPPPLNFILLSHLRCKCETIGVTISGDGGGINISG